MSTALHLGADRVRHCLWSPASDQFLAIAPGDSTPLSRLSLDALVASTRLVQRLPRTCYDLTAISAVDGDRVRGRLRRAVRASAPSGQLEAAGPGRVQLSARSGD